MSKSQKPKPAKEQTTESEGKTGERLKRLSCYARLEDENIPQLERSIAKRLGVRKALQEANTGTIQWIGSRAMGANEDGLNHDLAAVTRELNSLLNTTHPDPEREKSLHKRERQIRKEMADNQAAASEELRSEAEEKRLLERALKFRRQKANVRVVEVNVPTGKGDARVYLDLIAQDAKLAKAEDKVKESPPDTEEQIADFRADADDKEKRGRRAINLDGFAEPDGKKKIVFGGQVFRDSATGALVETPICGELFVALFPKEFRAFCEAKLRGHAERSGETGITKAEREKKLAELRRKRFDVALKIEGEYRACADRGIGVVRPGNLNLFALLGVKPVRFDLDVEDREERIPGLRGED